MRWWLYQRFCCWVVWICQNVLHRQTQGRSNSSKLVVCWCVEPNTRDRQTHHDCLCVSTNHQLKCTCRPQQAVSGPVIIIIAVNSDENKPSTTHWLQKLFLSEAVVAVYMWNTKQTEGRVVSGGWGDSAVEVWVYLFVIGLQGQTELDSDSGSKQTQGSSHLTGFDLRPECWVWALRQSELLYTKV